MSKHSVGRRNQMPTYAHIIGAVFLLVPTGYVFGVNGLYVPTTPIAMLLLAVLFFGIQVNGRAAPFLTSANQKLLNWLAASLILLRVAIGYFETSPIHADLYWSFAAMVCLYPILMLLLGRIVSAYYSQLRTTLFLSAGALAACILYGSIVSFLKFGSIFFYFNESYQGDVVFSFNPHSVGDAAAVCFLLVLPHAGKFRSITFISAAALLALSYSRASLICFIGAYAIASVSSFRRFSGAVQLAASSVLLISVAMLLMADLSSLNNFEVVVERLLSIWNPEDESRLGRENLMSSAPQLIMEFGGWGRPMYELDGSGAGAYLHNFLSYWVAFGTIPFLVLTAAVILGAKRAFSNASAGAGEARLLVVVFCLLEIAFFRSHTFYYLWLALGMCATDLMRRSGGAMRSGAFRRTTGVPAG